MGPLYHLTNRKDRVAALLAAGMIALNGHHVYWSQMARKYPVASFVGLLSTVLLLLASQSVRRRRVLQLLYAVVTLGGLSLSTYFWPLFLTHILWVLRRSWSHKTMPGMLRWQFLVSILSSPLLSLIVFQARRESYLSRDPRILLGGLSQFLQLLGIRDNIRLSDLLFQLMVTLIYLFQSFPHD